jgi:5-methylcytosine-specific restriction endonuclease McrA
MSGAGVLTVKILQEIYEGNIKKYGTLTCCLCGRGIEFGQDSLEHLTPISRGGTNDKVNLGVAHRKCNFIKGVKTLQEYLERSSPK